MKDLQVVHLAGEASKLVVIADSEIRAVPLHNCDSPLAASCATCVALQDPHCAWDAAHSQCVAVMTRLHDSDADKMLFQNISSGKHKGCGYEQGIYIEMRDIEIDDAHLYYNYCFLNIDFAAHESHIYRFHLISSITVGIHELPLFCEQSVLKVYDARLNC